MKELYEKGIEFENPPDEDDEDDIDPENFEL